MSVAYYLKGENIRPRYVSEARKLIGKKVQYLRHSNIDKSGRGYFFPRSGTVNDAEGRNIAIDGEWHAFSDIAEMVEKKT